MFQEGVLGAAQLSLFYRKFCSKLMKIPVMHSDIPYGEGERNRKRRVWQKIRDT